MDATQLCLTQVVGFSLFLLLVVFVSVVLVAVVFVCIDGPWLRREVVGLGWCRPRV